MSHLATPADEPTLGDNLVRVIKLVHHIRSEAPRPHPDVDPLAYPVMFTLWHAPRRVSDLADKVYADVSTVSRQVTHLVGLGLVERLSDPEDGRAHLAALTDAGVDLLTSLRRSRNEWLLGLLEGWTNDDIQTFSDYLERFADAVEHSRTAPAHEAAGEAATSTPSTQEVS